jgi:hypothetical protein
MLKEHHKLFENPVSKIGEFHYKILESEIITDKNRHDDKSVDDAIAGDEIHWWIFYKEKDLKELQDKTEKVLESAQKLKEDSVKLKEKLIVKEYSKLIDEIKKFSVDQEIQIQSLIDYVDWLTEKDPMAPIILFNYRIWGSTRMGDRRINVLKRDYDTTIKACTEIALGLRRSYHGPTVGRVYNNVLGDILDSKNPEDYETPIEIPWEDVAIKTTYEVLDEMSQYFECLRDALRNILLDIKEYEISESILYDDNFWRSFVKKVITLPVENSRWDFKQTLGMWTEKGSMKKEKEIEFCADVSSFANMEGGVLIIGISNKLPRKIIGLDDLENKMKYAKDVIMNGIHYPRELTHFHVLTLDDETGSEKQCLLVIIKKAMSTVSVNKSEPIKNDGFSGGISGSVILPMYYIRNETGITRVERNMIDNSKMHLKHDSYDFLKLLKPNFS